MEGRTNGLRKPRMHLAGSRRRGGHGLCLGAEKTRRQPVLVIDQGKMLAVGASRSGE